MGAALTMGTMARSNSHIRGLANLWFVVCGLTGLLLMVAISNIPGNQDLIPALRDLAYLTFAFLLALVTALGLPRRWVVARLVNFIASIACILGALWLINDTINVKRNNPMLDMSWYLQNPLVSFPILLGVGLGIYGIWAMLTQWAPESRRHTGSSPAITETGPLLQKPVSNQEKGSVNMIWDFGFLLALAYVLGLIASGVRAIGDGCTTGCGLVVLLLLPVALLLALIELFRVFKYRLWAGTRLYWLLAAIGLAIVRGYLVAIRS